MPNCLQSTFYKKWIGRTFKSMRSFLVINQFFFFPQWIICNFFNFISIVYRPNYFASWILANFCFNKFFWASNHFRWRQLLRIWQWRHRTWPEFEKILLKQNFAEIHDAKRIMSISFLSCSKKGLIDPFKKHLNLIE